MNASLPESSPTFNDYLTQTVAGLLVIASAGFGMTFAWHQGSHHGWLLALLSVVMALALEVAKPIAVATALRELGQWNIARGVAVAALAVVAVAYSLTAEVQLMATARANTVATRSVELNADTLAKRAELKAELDSIIPKPRTSGELKPLIDAAKRIGGDCSRPAGKAARDSCKALPGLQSEAARAARVESLLARLEAQEGRYEATKRSRDVDPGASAVATYLGLVFGIKVDSATLADLIVLVGVLALEVGSAAAGLLIAQPSPRSAVVQPGDQKMVHEAGPTAPDSVVVHAVQSQPERISEVLADPVNRGAIQSAEAREAAQLAILNTLKNHDGRTTTSERKLASKVGASRSTARRALHSLIAAGVVIKAGEALVLRG